MALPAIVTVNAVIRDKAGPTAGRIVFVRSAVLFPASTSDGDFAIPEEVEVVVGSDGVLAVPLFSSNDPAASPTGWTWEVRTHFPHWRVTFSIVVPYDAAGGQVNLNRLAPVPPDGDGVLYALSNHTHGGGGSGIVVNRERVAVSGSGGLLTLNNSPSTWVQLTSSPTISIPAVAGDYLEFEILQMLFQPGANFLDLAVVVSAAAARYMVSDTNSPGAEGNPSFYPQPGTYRTYGPTFEFVAQAGDISGGNVTVAFWTKGAGTGTLYAHTDYPLKWRAVNYGAITVA